MAKNCHFLVSLLKFNVATIIFFFLVKIIQVFFWLEVSLGFFFPLSLRWLFTFSIQFLHFFHRGSSYRICMRIAGTVICLRLAATDTDPCPMVELSEAHWYFDHIHLLRTPDPNIWMSPWHLLLQRSQRQLISACPILTSWSFPQNVLLSQGPLHQVMASTAILCFKP